MFLATKNKLTLKIVTVVIFASFTLELIAQQNFATVLQQPSTIEYPKANISLIDRLVGTCTVDGFGGHIQEICSKPEAGFIIGMFKPTGDGTPNLYEFMIILTKKGHKYEAESL